MNARSLVGWVLLACVALTFPVMTQEIQGGARTATTPAPSAGLDATAISDVELAAVDRFQAAYPGTLSHREGSQLTRLYGRTFEVGDTPVQTADRFLIANAGLFGAEAADLLPATRILPSGNTLPLMYDAETGTYKFTLVYHSQYRDGIPVFRSDVRTLVKNETGYPLVWVGSSLKPLGNFHPEVLLRSSVEPMAVAPAMVNFTAAEPVIWAGIDDKPSRPAQAVTFIADNYGSGTAPQKWLYVVDAATGKVLFQEDQIVHTDVSGSVHGKATTLPKSAECNPEVDVVMPYAKVAIGSTVAYADVSGNFTIPNSGTSSVTVTSYMSGQYFTVAAMTGTLETLTMSVTPPGPANFMHNSADTDPSIIAQVNAYVEANRVRAWVLAQNPSYPTIATQTNFPLNVNYALTCNAYYDYSSLNFYLAGGGCANSAFSNVVHHEYGHHIVSCGGSGQDQYGEGMGDSVAVCIADDPVLGYGFHGDCGAGIRTAANSMQYPCSGEVHACAPLLSGCVWSTRNQLQATNPLGYLGILSSLVLNSVPLHSGGTITPQITIDFLTLDDDDGNLNNGTPHWSEICSGFGAHNMACPELPEGMSVGPTLSFISTGQEGGPFSPASKVYTVENLGPAAPISYTATASASWLTITNGSGTLAAVGDTAQVTLAINSNALSLAAGDYTDTVYFTNTTTHVGDITRTVTLRVGINDNCADARSACPGPSYTGSTTGMTVDGTTSCGTSNSTPDVWYKYTPGTSGSATFSLCSNTDYDSVMSIHSGCPGSALNTLGCNDDACGLPYDAPSEVTLSVTGGTTYIIRIGGWNGAIGSYTLTISGPACASDATPPTPSPMTFASAPAAADSSSITMTATTATDAGSPPVRYYFNFVSGGAGGNDSAWQAGTGYTDSGLSPNTLYTYRVKARDSASPANETSYSGNASATTLAAVPSAPTLGGATRTALNLDVNAGDNPAATEFAVMCTGSSPTDLNWNGKYVNTSGAASTIAVWRTEPQWAVATVQDLQACTTYTFAVEARNTDLVPTALGTGASLGTAGRTGDMNGDGTVDGDDIQAFVTCAVSGGSGCSCASMTVPAFVDCLLDAGTCP
jgi:hypothetical protein